MNGKKVVTKGLGKEVVLELMDEYLDKKHIVITDNFYTSVELAETLLTRKTFLIGQIKGNAKGLNSKWITEQRKELKSKKGSIYFLFRLMIFNYLGSFDWLMKNELALFSWSDTKVNFMLGTWAGIQSTEEFKSTIDRKKK